MLNVLTHTVANKYAIVMLTTGTFMNGYIAGTYVYSLTAIGSQSFNFSPVSFLLSCVVLYQYIMSYHYQLTNTTTQCWAMLLNFVFACNILHHSLHNKTFDEPPTHAHTCVQIKMFVENLNACRAHLPLFLTTEYLHIRTILLDDRCS